MKHFLLALVVFSVSHNLSFAQTPFATADSLTINNIHPTILVHGDMWWNPATWQAACDFPGPSGFSTNSAGSIWLSGYDDARLLHVSAQTYRQGNDFWPGPLDDHDTLNYETSGYWAFIWKVNESDIDSFRSLPTHTLATTPMSILTWPGKGNAYAQGNGGAYLSVTTNMAPFVDLNGNGIYEPLLGEYPAIKGQQALWWVFSDNGPTHNQTNGRPLGIEVHAMAYGYNRGTIIDDVVYYEYTLVNKSTNNYHNLRLALWNLSDIENGSFDDFLGFDSTWRMAITYAATVCVGCAAGRPFRPVIQTGLSMVSLPGDSATNFMPAGSLLRYDNDSSFHGNPFIDSGYSNYMRAKWLDGSHLTYDYSGPQIQSTGYGPGPDCNYLFSGDPSDTNGWSECNCGNNPTVQHLIFASNDFNLFASSSQKIVIAQLVADSAGGCGETNFSKIRILADTAWGSYSRETVSVTDPSLRPSPVVYPNPTHNMLNIDLQSAPAMSCTLDLTDLAGRVLYRQTGAGGSIARISLSGIAPGLYLLAVRTVTDTKTYKIIKQ